MILVAVCFLAFSIVADPASKHAFQWAFPIWTQANLRFGSSAAWDASGHFLGSPSANFQIDAFAKRRIGANPPSLTLCNSAICTGTPFVLNPAPVVSPNVDTLYGGAWLDLNRALFLTVPNPNGRYYSINFLDMYTNVRFQISNANFGTGGRFCLYHTAAQLAVFCHAPTAPPNIPIQFNDRFLFAIARVYSSGQMLTTCPNPLAPTQQIPGPDGCGFFEQVTLGAISNIPAVENVFADYLPLMNPTDPAACGYHYGQAPCSGGDEKAYWLAVCKVLIDSPPGAEEAAYIDKNFAQFGIRSTGCDATTLDFKKLHTGFDAGWAAIQQGEFKDGVGSPDKAWRFIPFDGTWEINEQGIDLRASSSARLHALVANPSASYWVAFQDSQEGNILSCANGTKYRIDFAAESIPVDYAHGGFWSFTLYDATWFLVGAHTGVRGNTAIVPNTIHIYQGCAAADCLSCPNGEFHVNFRGYRPEAALLPGGAYLLPKITVDV